MHSDLIYNAVQCYGGQVVADVIEMVKFSDAQTMLETYEKYGMKDYVECVEFLFF